MTITAEDLTLTGFFWIAVGSIAAFWAALTVYSHKMAIRRRKLSKKKGK